MKISVGGESFIALRNSGSYYVDKTELLYDLFHNTNNAVTIFHRPRRFGKTLTMSMMEAFFSIDKKKDISAFNGLDIMRHEEFCQEYMNQYPVLFISLKNVEGRSFELALDKLKTILAKICIEKTYLLEYSNINPFDKKIFEQYQSQSASEANIQDSLALMMRMMHTAYGKPVILLIDEYDVPLAKAHANGYYRQMLDVIRGMMNASLKTNDDLKFAVVTGCLRIPKESIFTGVNNFVPYSVLNDRFSQYFGFTDAEVKKMLDYFGLSEKEEVMRNWYDGYQFGKTQIYCPWDVASYVSDLLYDRNALPQDYWENTSSNDAMNEFFRINDPTVTDRLEKLMNGQSISVNVSNALTYDSVYESIENLWSVLLMTGYLTVSDHDRQLSAKEGKQPVSVRIPNREIQDIFQAAVNDHFKKTVNKEKIQELLNAFWNGDEKKASETLTGLLFKTISYMDYAEDYYHAFLAGIFAGQGMYIVESNREQGLGRSDIDIEDPANHRAIIIEAKVSRKKEDMAYWCEDALGQIEKEQYAKGLDEDVYHEILCYGVCFYKKMAMVKKA